jgi:hypothetical protein
MRRLAKQVVLFLAWVPLVVLSLAGTARAQAGVTTHMGTLDDGATYLIEVPANVDATDLNNVAAALGPGFNIFGTPQGVVPVPPAYIKFDPNRYLRPFDALTEE